MGIIIDEIDGLGSVERGSLTELISIISDSKKKNKGSLPICISDTLAKN